MSINDPELYKKILGELAALSEPLAPELTATEAVLREQQMDWARRRAKLSVLKLTDKDKAFLKSLKVAT